MSDGMGVCNMTDKNYVAMEQIGICKVCGKEEDLRFGACYHCADLVSGEQISDKTHRLWETENPSNEWFASEDFN